MTVLLQVLINLYRMQFTGIITRITPPVKVNTKKGENWMQTFELTYEQGQHPRKIAFDVFGTDKLKEFRISLNEQVMCYIDFDVAEVNGKLYNRVRCWKVERRVHPQANVQQMPPQQVEEKLPF